METENRTGNQEATQQQKEQVSPSFVLGKKLVEQKELQQQQKTAEEYSVAERLMRAAANQTVTVKLHDDLGEFTVYCRRFTWSEQERLLDLNRKLHTQNTQEVLSREEINKQFFGLLAYPNGVCLNKELDMAFWLKGEYSLDLPRLILLTCQQQSVDSVDAARSFRQPTTRLNPA